MFGLYETYTLSYNFWGSEKNAHERLTSGLRNAFNVLSDTAPSPVTC